MDQIIEQNARQILHSDAVPPRIVKLADSLALQSSTSIPLKPNQEPARVHICCTLAIEKLGEKLDLPLPDIRKPPIPPAQYMKLLSQFKSVLMPELGGPVTPTKSSRASSRTPTRTPTRSPLKTPKTPTSRTPRAARKKAVDYLKDEMEEDRVNHGDDDDEEFPNLAFDKDEEEDDIKEFSTPRKRPPSDTRLDSPSPRKSPRKRVSGPQPNDIETIGMRMGLERSTIDTVLLAFGQYRELVKDAWGLICGLLIVVGDRAEPVVGAEHERRFMRAFSELMPHVQIDREEWINWVDKIVTGQTWIMNISKRPEPQPNLIGAPGGWGLGTEFHLVE